MPSPLHFATGVDSSMPMAPERFQSGTPNVPALYAARAGYEIVAEIGVAAIREKSLRLTRRMIDQPRGRVWHQHAARRRRARRRGDPRRAERRSRVEGASPPNIIIDYRPDAGIRMSPHFYNNEDEIDDAMKVLDDVIAVGARSGW